MGALQHPKCAVPTQESPCQRTPPPSSSLAAVPARPASWSGSPPTGRSCSPAPGHPRGGTAHPGSGRIWRYEQDPGLMLNSAAADVTMFTDASVACEGPCADGPDLAAWAAGVLAGTIADVPELPAELRRQLQALSGATFPTRQLHSAYLEWFFRRAVAAARPGRHRHRPPGHRGRHRPSPAPQGARRRRVPGAPGRRRSAAGRRRGDRPGPQRCAAGCGVRGVGRLRRPARRVPCGTQLHHGRGLFGRSPRART